MMAPPNLAELRLPSTDVLDGRAFSLEVEPEGCVELAFSSGTAKWSTEGMRWPRVGTDRVDVVEAAPDTYFIDIDVEQPVHTSLTAVLSLATGWALLVHQQRDPSAVGRGPAASQVFAAARVAGYEQHGPAPAPTRDMVGRWHRYRYSSTDLYEHVYISGDRFVSHNLDTVNTPDRADCHPVSYFKVAPELYVVAWTEFDSQASMVTLEDLASLRTTGKVLYPVGSDRSGSSPIGGLVLPAAVTFAAEERG